MGRVRFWMLLVVWMATRTTLGAGVPPNGDVELLLRGPDAKLAAQVEVHLTASDKIPFTDVLPDVTTTTDTLGVAHFVWPGGVYQMKVRVKGMGYGVSGLVEVIPGKTAQVPLAPLAPFAHLTGTLPAGMGQGVTVSAYGSPSGDTVATTPDAAGHFELEGPGASWWVFGERGGRRVVDATAAIYAGPGQLVTVPALVVVPPPATMPAANPVTLTTPAVNGGQPEEATWAQGTVCDTTGKPVAHATVYGLGTYFGGIRMYERVASAQSDEAGHYVLKGAGDLEMFSGTLLATAPGYTPAWAWISASGGQSPPAATAPGPAPVNLVLSDHGGMMDVTVLQEGEPVAKAGVILWLQGANLRDMWARGGGPEHDAVHHAAYPFAAADESGVAHFENLLPGRYLILAARGEEKQLRGMHEYSQGNQAVSGTADGIAVRSGEKTSFRLNICQQSRVAHVKAYRADGALMEGENFSVNYGRFDPTGTTSGSRADKSGYSRVEFSANGLWAAEFRYRDSPIQAYPFGKPYYAAGGILAVSPLIPESYEPVWHARRYEPGSIRVKVLDAAGQPARAVVEIVQQGGSMLMTGSTDEAGEVLFESFPTWQGARYAARVTGPLAPAHLDYSDHASPIPGDEVLIRTAIRPEPVTIPGDQETQVTLRPQPMAWVRGKIIAPAGVDLRNASVYASTEPLGDVGSQFNPKTGEYAVGPLQGGKVTLGVYCPWPQGEGRRTQEVAIAARKVTHVDLQAPEMPASGSPAGRSDRILLGVGGITFQASGGDLVTGEVFLPDGKTPAWGAQVLFFSPEQQQPSYAGIADPQGRIRTRGLWMGQSTGPMPEGSPLEAVAVAYLPGSYGATIVPLPKAGAALRITLPTARSVLGSVKVGAANPPAKGRIRVVASYQGKGKLNAVLSSQTTADSDGRFELAGLTPGTYQMQAALDDIWLSETQVLEVGDQPLAPRQLTIGSPGGPSIVKVVDNKGHPLAGRILTLDRAAGPFNDLWPAEWVTDGAGVANLPTLEAGKHVIRLKGSPVVKEFDVPPLPVEGPLEILLQAGD